MKTASIFVIMLMFTAFSFGQKYMTKNGKISFFSNAPMEKIEANNNQVNCALDIKTGDFVFKVLMKSFEFEKALMQEHFNENYAESDKFPNASFKGKIVNITAIDLTKPGKYQVTVEGDLTIHGVTKKVTEKGMFEVANGKIRGVSTFKVKLADYGIKIPKTVVNNIAEEVEIKVDVLMDLLKK